MDIAEKFLPLITLAKSRAQRLELLENDNLRLAGMFKNKHPKEYVLFLAFLSAWENLPYFKAEITRRSAARKRDAEAEALRLEAFERLNKAEMEGKPVVREGHPMSMARDFREQEMPHLVHFNGEFFEHQSNRYKATEHAMARSRVARWMELAVNEETGNPILVNKRTVDDVVDSLRSLTVVSSVDVSPPIWLEPLPGDPEPNGLVACTNGLVHVESGVLMPSTPRLFNLNAVEYEYDDPAFVLPAYQWLKFLESIWPEAEGGAASKALLQEWFGLMLTTDTRYQKILLLLGPGRSGKGTIVRTLTRLIGEANVADTSLNQIGREFGRQNLIGKQMMVVSDMRLGSGTDVGATTETLLNISGEDRRSVPRKFLPDWTGGLHARIMLVGNLKLTLPDQSGALAMRYLPLILTKEFVGREDLDLGDKLKEESTAILLWALEGLRRLRARGHFVQTEAGTNLLKDIRKHASPLRIFLAERCVIGREQAVEKATLFEAYEEWAADEAVRDTHDLATFARELFAASGDVIGNGRPTMPDGSRPRVFTGVALKPEYALA